MMMCISSKECKNGVCCHRVHHEKIPGCSFPCESTQGVKGAICNHVDEPETKLINSDMNTEKTAEVLTSERGKNYGHPRDHFPLTQKMSDAWSCARSKALDNGAPAMLYDEELAVKHAVYMICDKLARAATNPMHKDNWDDIAGYALCAKRVLGLEE